MYDGLDSEPSHQELFVDAKGARHAKHKVSMLCDQDQGAIESHGAAWASTTRSNWNLSPIWFRIKLDHWTFRNLSLLPNFS